MNTAKCLISLGVILLPALALTRSYTLGDGRNEPAEKPHPIDVALDACLDKEMSTAGMTGCYDKAFKSWDKELNKNYQTLNGKFNAREKQSLKTAQQGWLRFRDQEYKLMNTIYSRLEGTMYQPMRVASVMELTKTRAMELKAYLQLLEME